MDLKKRFASALEKCPVTAILRGVTNDEIAAVCDALMDAGITTLEIPLNSPNAIESIRIAAAHCGDRAMVGAGTVLTVEDVQQVAAAGGLFIISPNTDTDVIRETVKLNLVSIPGFLTPTEGFTALKAGADYLKAFPAGRFGLAYIKDLQAVIKAPIIAVGGVDLANAAEFLDRCAGVGIGSALYKAGKSLEDIARDAAAFVAAAKK